MLRSPISIDLQEVSIEDALEAVSEYSGVSLLYSKDYLPKKRLIRLNCKNLSLSQVLLRILVGTDLTFVAYEQEIIIKPRQEALNTSEKATLSGYIRKKSNQEAMIGAQVYVPSLRVGAVSNQYGFFSLSLPKGVYEIIVVAFGYTSQYLLIEAQDDWTQDIYIEELQVLLDSIDITANTKHDAQTLNQLELSRIPINLAMIKQNPTFFGEFDLMKAVQLHPGVQNGTEGSTGLFIRGGGADQNLILIDDTPIYNVAHLLGFFSTFNIDAIKEVSLYKGGMPAKYGGRLSSVLDVRTREGSYEGLGVSGGIGSISSRLTLEGPFAKQKGAFLLTARRTYLDVLLKVAPKTDLARNDFFFYDINFKATLKPSSKHELSISAYTGKDDVSLQELFGTAWGNQTISLRWNTLLSPKLFSQFTGFYSNFSVASEVNLVSDQFGYLLNYDLRDTGFKHDFSYYITPRHLFEFGYSATWHRYLFGEVKPSSASSLVEPQTLDPSFAFESGAYISLDQEISPKLYAKWGLRFSRFDNIGEADVFVYDIDQSLSPGTTLEEVVDTISYAKGKRYNTYMGLEPRASIRYSINSRQSIKLSYNKTRQYIHQLTNTNTPSPVDMWAPANKYIPPQIADQLAVGYFYHPTKKIYSLSIEGYYKQMHNQIDFKPQASLLLNNHLETEILIGEGVSYGVEFMLRKHLGRFKGWVSYTLSKTERQVDGINGNTPYPTSFDRRHNLATVMSFKASKHVLIAANWTYASGIAYTFPVGKYRVGDFIIPYYTSRNGFRLEPVHRLDLSVTIFREMTEDRKNESSFVFSIYNAYAKKNTYAYVFRQTSVNSSETETVKLYLFSIVPSFTYNFKF